MANSPLRKPHQSTGNWQETSVHTNYMLHPATDLKSSSFERNVKNQRGDQNNGINKSNVYNDHKCQVYVHQYNKISNKILNSNLESNWRGGSKMHQHLYKHELSNYYDAKIGVFRKQFDSLSLNSKNEHLSGSSRMSQTHHHVRHVPEQMGSVPLIKTNTNAKINKLLLNPQHKTTIDKLEERYWATWKPDKDDRNKRMHQKPKKPRIKPIMYPLPRSSTSIKTEKANDCSACKTTSEKLQELQETPVKENEVTKNVDEEVTKDAGKNDDKVEEVIKVEVSKSIEEKEDRLEAPQPATIVEEVVVEPSVGNLKHTDSFILTAKKQNQDTPRYQQPKCIKLFKNASHVSTTPTVRIKGGTYPLKSCLKRNGSKSSNLGKSGSPIAAARTSSKNRRFIK